MEERTFFANATAQIKLDTKRKLEYLAKKKGKKLGTFLRELCEKETAGVVLPGPGEYESDQPFILPPEKKKREGYTPKYAKPETCEVRDRDYSGEINPEALKPTPSTKWMNEFKEDQP